MRIPPFPLAPNLPNGDWPTRSGQECFQEVSHEKLWLKRGQSPAEKTCDFSTGLQPYSNNKGPYLICGLEHLQSRYIIEEREQPNTKTSTLVIKGSLLLSAIVALIKTCLDITESDKNDLVVQMQRQGSCGEVFLVKSLG